MATREIIKKEIDDKRGKKLQRKIWGSIEHWEKSNWRRITNLWARIKNEEKRTELLKKLWI